MKPPFFLSRKEMMRPKILTFIVWQFCFMVTGIVAAQSIMMEWSEQIGGSLQDGGTDLSMDASGNVIIAGIIQGTVDFDPGLDSLNYTAAGSSDGFIQKLDSAGNLLWVGTLGGVGLDVVWSVTTDAAGNIFATGTFEGTIDVNMESGSTQLTSLGFADIFVLKTDPSGNLLWIRSMGDIGVSDGRSIYSDGEGGVFITGSFSGTVDFEPGIGSTTKTSLGSIDVFLLRLSTSGNLNWVQTYGGTSGDRGEALVVDASGNVYVTGVFIDTVDFDPGSGVSNLVSKGGRDVFIQKFDPTGILVWARSVGGTNVDESEAINVDDQNNVYVTGQFLDTVDFDPGPNELLLSSQGSRDFFVLKLDESGNLSWANSVGGPGIDESAAIFINAWDEVYVTGAFSETVDFDPGVGVSSRTSAGGFDAFFQKLSADGDLIWLEVLSGADGVGVGSMTLDSEGFLYSTGNYSGTVDFDPSSATNNLTSAGSSDIFVLKLKPSEVGVNEIDNLNAGYRIYPNPATDEIWVESLNESIRSISVLDITGKEVYVQAGLNQDKANLSLQGLSPGIYFVRITGEKEVHVAKVVKR